MAKDIRIHGVFEIFNPNPEQLREAHQRLRRCDCPRRYCWYWQSLRYDWEIKPSDGCTVATRHINQLQHDDPQGIAPWRECRRASGNSQHADFYESRDPHLMEDGFPTDFFKMVGKEYRQRKYERRKRGESKHSQDD